MARDTNHIRVCRNITWKDIFFNFDLYFINASYLGVAHINTVRQRRKMWHVFKRTYVFFSAPDNSENLLIRMKFAGV